jgi:hypothetical protein
MAHRGSPCVLRGYLRLWLLDGGGSPIGTRAVRSGSRLTGKDVRVRTVRLAGEQRASFEIDYTTEPGVLGPANRSCETISWMGIQLRDGRLDVPTRISPCGGVFGETPIQPGVLAPPRHE